MNVFLHESVRSLVPSFVHSFVRSFVRPFCVFAALTLASSLDIVSPPIECPAEAMSKDHALSKAIQPFFFECAL